MASSIIMEDSQDYAVPCDLANYAWSLGIIFIQLPGVCDRLASARAASTKRLCLPTSSGRS